MMNYSSLTFRSGFVLVFCFTIFACSQVSKSTAPEVPLYEHLGDHEYLVSTENPIAQDYFNQGLILSYGFNHAEALRSFKAAYELDPECAMCYWGAALVLGPNINAPMNPELNDEAYRLSNKAASLAARATEKEQALIQALTQRYGSSESIDRTILDQAYADAMADVASKFPDDSVILALYAEALMDLHPWDYWTQDGTPKPWTDEIVVTLEKALLENQNNPLANHLYIHILEASPYAEKALPSARRLPGLVPGSGHLVHMPAHIYIRLGLYHDAVKANQEAVQIDNNYLHHDHTESIYTQAYVPHNHHFLWAAAIKTGQKELALQAALDTAAHVDQALLRTPGFAGTLQHFFIIPVYTRVLFGEWDQLLAEPAPEKDLIYPTGIWHYARGLAWLRKGDKNQAQNELAQLSQLALSPGVQNLKIFDLNPVTTLLQISSNILQAEIALFEKDYQMAESLLKKAIDLEDSLNYTEPKDWYLPPRQVLGVVLLAQGEAELAEQVYREDLSRHPQNGWSLFGLMKSLRAQGRNSEADDIQSQFNHVWSEADIVLTESRF